MPTPTRLERLFAELDAWRHYPAYRLEPRIDAFFALYLPSVLEQHLRRPLLDVILPELPLRRGTLYGEHVASPNKSLKVDFVLFGADRLTVYFVELKTDRSSRRQRQDDYLGHCVKVGFPAILDGILKTVASTHSKYLRKYLHLLSALGGLGFIDVPSRVLESAYPEVQVGLARAIREIAAKPAAASIQVHVVYVQPEPDPLCDSIGFEEFARTVSQDADPLSAVFAKYLLRWRERAGALSPGPG